MARNLHYFWVAVAEYRPLAHQVISCAIAVHRKLGPGLMESVYEACLAYELAKHKVSFARQKLLPVLYDDIRLDCGFRLDLVVENELLVEVKSVASLLPIHTAQVLTYLKLSGLRQALLFNFNSPRLMAAARSFLNDHPRQTSTRSTDNPGTLSSPA